MPQATLNLEEISTHLNALADTQRCPRCDISVTQVITDTGHLLGELARLYNELSAAQLEAANLRAAIRATLSAAVEGESDPLAYLRWELPEDHAPSPDAGRGSA